MPGRRMSTIWTRHSRTCVQADSHWVESGLNTAAITMIAGILSSVASYRLSRRTLHILHTYTTCEYYKRHMVLHSNHAVMCSKRL